MFLLVKNILIMRYRWQFVFFNRDLQLNFYVSTKQCFIVGTIAFWSYNVEFLRGIMQAILSLILITILYSLIKTLQVKNGFLVVLIWLLCLVRPWLNVIGRCTAFHVVLNPQIVTKRCLSFIFRMLRALVIFLCYISHKLG